MNAPSASPAKKAALAARMLSLGIRETDLDERFVLGSGRGGQKVNKTSSCVFLRHGPSGLIARCGRSRHRELNRFLARRELCDRLEALRRGEADARRKAAEKVRRQKRRRSRRQKERILAGKRRQAEKKAGRRPPADD